MNIYLCYCQKSEGPYGYYIAAEDEEQAKIFYTEETHAPYEDTTALFLREAVGNSYGFLDFDAVVANGLRINEE